MILLVGLGNPGAKYERHRHNIGFMAVDEIAKQWGFGAERQRFQGATLEGRFETPQGAEKALVLKPMTYMNESGRSVAEAVHFFKLELSQVVVFHDELDLAPGKVRVKTGGGHAGHNGLRSIHAHLEANFRRVRLGIGHPGHKDAVHNYVLQDFAKSERVWLEPVIDAIGLAAPMLATGEDNSFMNKVFLQTHPEEADKKEKAAKAAKTVEDEG